MTDFKWLPIYWEHFLAKIVNVCSVNICAGLNLGLFILQTTFKTYLSFNCQLANQCSSIMCACPKIFLGSHSIMNIFLSNFPTRAFISVNDDLHCVPCILSTVCVPYVLFTVCVPCDSLLYVYPGVLSTAYVAYVVYCRCTLWTVLTCVPCVLSTVYLACVIYCRCIYTMNCTADVHYELYFICALCTVYCRCTLITVLYI